MISVLKKIWDRLCIKQWNIAVARMTFPELLQSRKLSGSFTWLPAEEKTRLAADPFVYKEADGSIHILYEDFLQTERYGKIGAMILDDRFDVKSKKILLDTRSHLSYPCILKDQNHLHVFPENSMEGGLSSFVYDSGAIAFGHKQIIIPGLPLLDSTILYHDGLFWMFATKRGPHSNEHLYIYYSSDWSGPYQEHAANPVKKSLSGSRPAGNFMEHEGVLYRPTQNCAKYYGKSVIINKITKLTRFEFEETPVFELFPPKGTEFNFGIHTINFSDDVIVIDGLRRIFAPVYQARTFMKKWLQNRKKQFPDLQEPMPEPVT